MKRSVILLYPSHLSKLGDILCSERFALPNSKFVLFQVFLEPLIVLLFRGWNKSTKITIFLPLIKRRVSEKSKITTFYSKNPVLHFILSVRRRAWHFEQIISRSSLRPPPTPTKVLMSEDVWIWKMLLPSPYWSASQSTNFDKATQIKLNHVWKIRPHNKRITLSLANCGLLIKFKGSVESIDHYICISAHNL